MNSNSLLTQADIVAPNASSLVESLRAFGYDLATALADLADNSLSHDSRQINIHFHWAGENSAIALGDDGNGMDEQTLLNSLRLGSRNPRDDRAPGDFGRFGLGLKTASFSQCRRLTVFTRRNKKNCIVRCWDLDHIAQTNEWQLLRTPSTLAASLAEKLGTSPQGTIVIWEKLDRLTAGSSIENDSDEDAFLRQAELVRDHFAMVFHRFMSKRPPVAFYLNARPILPWDPFLIDEPATQRLPLENARFQEHVVRIEPFVLPHLSKLDAETHRKAAGLRGWNAHQGFYIYRNGRLIVSGSWLGLKGWRQEEHYKLARISVDLPNALDLEWGIDVTKSKATPPEKFGSELIRIGERTRSIAKRIYSHRGAKLMPSNGEERVFLWEQTVKHNKISYRINREHPLVESVRAASTGSHRLNALLRLIEETVPVPLITITDREKPDQTLGPFETAKESEILEVMRQILISLKASGLSDKDAILRLACFEPFQNFPQLLQTLKEEERS